VCINMGSVCECVVLARAPAHLVEATEKDASRTQDCLQLAERSGSQIVRQVFKYRISHNRIERAGRVGKVSDVAAVELSVPPLLFSPGFGKLDGMGGHVDAGHQKTGPGQIDG